MALTEQDLEKQDREIERLKDEFSRLNSQYDAQLKALGITEAEARAALENPPLELKAQIAEAQLAAERAGEARAGQAQTASAAPGKARPGARAGAIRL